MSKLSRWNRLKLVFKVAFLKRFRCPELHEVEDYKHIKCGARMHRCKSPSKCWRKITAKEFKKSGCKALLSGLTCGRHRNTLDSTCSCCGGTGLNCEFFSYWQWWHYACSETGTVYDMCPNCGPVDAEMKQIGKASWLECPKCKFEFDSWSE